MGDIFSGIGNMLGSNTKSAVSYQGDPYTGQTQTNLGQFFSALGQPSGQSAGGTPLPAYSSQPYQGQLTTLGPDYNSAQNMFQSAVQGYNPNLYNNTMNQYQNISQTGMLPQYQQYLDATSKAASNQWNQNVMPQVAEQARGFGSGSIMPQAIAQAGQNFNTALAGQMAPYGMQAANQSAQNQIMGTQGMLNTANQMTTQPFNVAQDTNNLASYFQQLQQQGLTANQNLYNQNAYSLLPSALQFTGQSKGGYYGTTQQPTEMSSIFAGLGNMMGSTSTVPGAAGSTNNNASSGGGGLTGMDLMAMFL